LQHEKWRRTGGTNTITEVIRKIKKITLHCPLLCAIITATELFDGNIIKFAQAPTQASYRKQFAGHMLQFA
jgi:hypothetical protein